MKFDNAKLHENYLPITSGSYTITGALDAPAKAKYPSIVLRLFKDDTGTKHSKLVGLPKDMNDINPQTNFGRLFKAFGNNTETWQGRQIDISIDEQGKKHIYPVEKPLTPISATT
jgi:hypothetical protein